MPDSFAEILEKGFEHCRDMDAPLSARLEAENERLRVTARDATTESREALIYPD